jgi:hypothetical protein
MRQTRSRRRNHKECKNRSERKNHSRRRSKNKGGSNFKETGYDPLSLNIVNIKEWLIESDDNIIIIFENNNYCIKRSFFNENGLFPFAFLQSCVLDKPFFDDEFYIDLNKLGIKDSGIMRIKDLDIFHQNKQNYYNIIKTKKEINTISRIKVNNHYINQIQLHDLNLRFNDEERKYILNYTLTHYRYINKYLRGDSNDTFNKKYDVINHIKHIDNIIYKYGSISSRPIKLYRGTNNFKNDFGLHLAYISTSTSLEVSEKEFSNTECCVYHLNLSPGIPFLSLEGVSNYKGEEFEVLLPRDLTVTLIKEYELDIFGILRTQYDCTVDMTTPTQFASFKCDKHYVLKPQKTKTISI